LYICFCYLILNEQKGLLQIMWVRINPAEVLFISKYYIMHYKRYQTVLSFCIALTLLSSCDKKEEEESNGSITFWTNNLSAHGGYMNVTIEGTSKPIILSWPSLPDCNNTQGTASFELASGTYSYTVTDGNSQFFYGLITVYANDCTGKQLD